MPEVVRSAEISDEEFVAGLYRNLLRRQPKIQEVEHWKAILSGGTARTDVVEVFMSSSEYLNLQQQTERFQVSSNLPADPSEQERYILSELQAHVVRFQQGVPVKGAIHQREPVPEPTSRPAASPEPTFKPVTLPEPASLPEPTSNYENLMRLSSDIWKAQEEIGRLNPRNPGPVNSLMQVGKKILQRSLSWYTRSLQVFHHRIAAAIEEQGIAINSIDRFAQQQRQEVRRLEGDTQKLEGKTQHLEGEAHKLQGEIQKLEVVIQHLGGEIRKLQADRRQIELAQNSVRAIEYATQEHLAPYVEFFRASSPVVDLGCGRGEFLDLLKIAGVTSYGIDSDEEAVAAALQRGLTVFEEDVFQHLADLPERSLGGIFCARLIEFLPPSQLPKLLELCSSRMKPGGVLLMETTNSSSQLGFGRITNLDPTHLRPVAPELMLSMLESSGFHSVKMLVSAPLEVNLKGTANQASGSGNAPGKPILASPTYAVVGWRS